ncbi:MAG TPA: phospholipase D-like domain-containing protein, partial [Thermoanaerobaculia bacterium]|nr:phospholipase D-like domain-containing protein [Thermoanaerobaculia bacterium]
MWKIDKYKPTGTHYIRVPLVAAISLVILVVGLAILLWSAERGRSVHLDVKQPGDFGALLPSIVGLTQSTLEPGNRVQLLENGDQFFPALLQDIADARESVHVESYIWWTGDICERMANALAAKARQGVEVRLLVDASGGHKMDDKLKKLMKDAGVQLRDFHPVRFSNLGRLNNRDHRKVAVIDGRIGFIGGFGIAKEWTGHAQDKEHWRDTGLRVMGPIVNQLQGAFCENWVEETGEIPAGERYFPHLTAVGPSQAHVAYTSPTGSVSSVQVLYYLAIRAARHEVLIQNPYMLPDQDAINAFADAVRRGVDIRVMVPATSSTDSPIVEHASHHIYGKLMRAGVKIYEYEPTLLHQKVIIVDGIWSCVGSTNFDDRSFQLNDEISMGVLDATLAS